MKRLEQYDVFSLPVSQVFYDADFNCRGAFTLQSVEELAQSIDELGLQFPVVVQPTEEVESFEHEGFRWRLIAGHRRYQAVATLLKWTEMRQGPSPRRVRELSRLFDADRRTIA